MMWWVWRQGEGVGDVVWCGVETGRRGGSCGVETGRRGG